MHPSAHSIKDVDVDLAPLNFPRQQAVADDADGESVEAMLLRMLEADENISGFPSLSTMCQVVGGNEHGPPVISGSPPVWDPDDCLQEDDLVASASEDDCVPSMTLDDEDSDPEALRRGLAPSTEVSPRGSHQEVLMQPPPSGSLGGSSSRKNNKSSLVIKIVVYASEGGMDMVEDMDTSEKGPGKNKRKWTDTEDKELVYALFDMVNAGTHKADNGFKPGFLGVIEAVLKQKLPASGIKAKPHIDSIIKTMKKDFRVVYDMLNGENCSGFGCDPIKNVVVAEDEVWNGYVKTHKGAGQWRSRSFPHYEMLCTIFGKDRATGKGAATAEDVLDEVIRNEENVDPLYLGMDFEEVERYTTPVTTPSTTPSTNSEGTSQKGKRKRSTDNMESFREAAMIIGNKIDEATEKFSRAIGVDLDIANKRDKINEELRNHCGNLERMERHKALIAIARDHEMTAVFFTLENDEKEDFVRALLSGGL